MAFIAANNNISLMVNLTGNEYIFESPVFIKNSIVFTSNQKTAIAFTFKPTQSEFLFHLVAGHSLQFSKINLDLKNVQTGSFIISDTSGSSNHVNFKMNDCSISNLSGTLFSAAKSSVADSIIIRNTNISNGKGMLFNFLAEKDKRGYYNVEKLIMRNNTFSNHIGPLLAMLRGGNDESTLGPNLLFTNNNLTDCNSGSEEAIIYLYGTQYSHMENNTFTNCNPGKNLLLFEDAVRAKHQLRNNVFAGSGNVITNKYVVEGRNVVR
jgi:poly(beta-D-mannuronate) lyase